MKIAELLVAQLCRHSHRLLGHGPLRKQEKKSSFSRRLTSIDKTQLLNNAETEKNAVEFQKVSMTSFQRSEALNDVLDSFSC